jgi:UDP-glucose 4-epimerase
VNELVDKMYNIADKPRKVNYTKERKGDVEVTHSDISKAQNLLGYNPKVDIDEGLKRTYEWQKNH